MEFTAGGSKTSVYFKRSKRVADDHSDVFKSSSSSFGSLMDDLDDTSDVFKSAPSSGGDGYLMDDLETKNFKSLETSAMDACLEPSGSIRMMTHFTPITSQSESNMESYDGDIDQIPAKRFRTDDF